MKVFFRADVPAMSGLLANMTVDMSVTASLTEAWNLLVSSRIDTLYTYCPSVLSNRQPPVIVPFSLSFPFLCWFSLNRIHSRLGLIQVYMNVFFALCQVKNQPLVYLILTIHPGLYRFDNISGRGALASTGESYLHPLSFSLQWDLFSRMQAP